MSGVEALRTRLVSRRDELRETEDLAARVRGDLATAESTLLDALRRGDSRAAADAEERRRAAEEDHRAVLTRLAEVRAGIVTGIGDFLGEAGEEAGELGDVVLAGIERDVPIALLPVRLETRFAGPDSAPVLRVRIYPDDIHLDEHEPALSRDEVSAGQRYWTAVDAGEPEEAAWTGLATAAGPHRALWVRERTEPTTHGAPPTFGDTAVRPDGTSRPATARALPDLFLVRVRARGETIVTAGGAVADALQVGVDLSGPPAGSGEATDPDLVTLGAEAAWLSDFAAAKAAGMAVEVPLPDGTTVVDDVTVVGTQVSLAPDEAAGLLAEMAAHHRVTRGAGFVAPGTPTNNLADSTSGWVSRPDPARLDPAALPPVGETSNAAVAARALGIDVDALAGLVGADAADSAEAAVMARALFEATWGPYLRTQAQPGFPVQRLPQVHTHVTTWLRGGGPLPTVRLGRQPYGVLPVQPRRPWAAAPGDDDLTRWLADHLPRLRALWLAGRGQVPSGLAAYSHEAVSSRVRVRTAHASTVRPWLAGFGLGPDAHEAEVQELRLVAELGLGEVLPTVVSQVLGKRPVDLWLPMSDEDDLDFFVVDPDPRSATSVLGLLLRNAALHVSSNYADLLLVPQEDLEVAGYAARTAPAVSVPELAGLAVSTSPDLAVEVGRSFSDTLTRRVADAGGAEATVAEHLERLLAGRGAVGELDDYRHREAFLTYAAAHEDLAAIPSDRRARLAGEVLDCASHRYDAWVTSLATRRLHQMRERRPTGLQLGAWGVVHGVRRRRLTTVDRPDVPGGVVAEDPANQGFVLAPSLQHANAAGVLRAAWAAHGGSGDPEAPFAIDLRSERVRRALVLAEGMRTGQPLGALLGYQLERALHEAPVELDWAVFELRRRHPSSAVSGENVGAPDERQVVDGWRVAQQAMKGAAELDDLVREVVASAPAGIAPTADLTEAMSAAVRDLVGSLDGLMDLGLAESVHQLSGSNLARAAAAGDMIGRAAVPPDTFEVTATPRQGRGVDQRLVVALGGTGRPAGWVGDRPRARLAPLADAFVARRLGPLSGLRARLVDAQGQVVASVALSSLRISALDLAADAAATAVSTRHPLLLARVREVAGAPTAALALDPREDERLLDLLEHAASWHRALAGRRPLSRRTLLPSGLDLPEEDGASAVDPGEAVSALVEELAGLLPDDDEPDAPVDVSALWWWGLDPGTAAPQAPGVLRRRLAEARAAADPALAARALLGGDAVVTGTVTLTEPAPWGLDQHRLGVTEGGLRGWVQDTGRVRDAARALDEAMLHADLARGGRRLDVAAGQTPAADGTRWVGQAFPGELGDQPVASYVVVHDTAGSRRPGSRPGELTGIELDSWVESVPERGGAGAVAANLSSPDSRAPNTILLAVPADLEAPWTQTALFSVVDEALELAECRLVDLDATRRVPAVLPAVYISDFDDGPSWRDVVRGKDDFPLRYVARGTS